MSKVRQGSTLEMPDLWEGKQPEEHVLRRVQHAAVGQGRLVEMRRLQEVQRAKSGEVRGLRRA